MEESVKKNGAETAYAGLLAASEKNTTSGYASDFMTTSPEAVAAVILRAVESTRPRARYVVTSAAKAMINLRRLGGDRMWDATMRNRFGL